MALINFTSPFLTATPNPLTPFYQQPPPHLAQPATHQLPPYRTGYSYPTPQKPFLDEDYSHNSQPNNPPQSVQRPQGFYQQGPLQPQPQQQQQQQQPTFTRVTDTGSKTKVHAVIDYDYEDEDEPLPPVTPIQGPIFIKNGSVPVVPLYSHPVLNNGSFVQIPVSAV